MDNLWALEESVEDAFVAYLAANMPGTVRHYPAYTAEAEQFPMTATMASASRNVEDLPDVAVRAVTVSVGLWVESIPQKDAGGAVISTAREANRSLRAKLFSLFVGTGEEVAAALNAVASPGVIFSSVNLEAAARSVEGRCFETMLTVECIACPKDDA